MIILLLSRQNRVVCASNDAAQIKTLFYGEILTSEATTQASAAGFLSRPSEDTQENVLMKSVLKGNVGGI